MSHRDKWDKRYAGRELVWSAGPNQNFADIVSALPPGKALDVACGEGRNALWLAEQGWSVTAVDFSQVALGKAQRIAHRREVAVDWVVGDVADVLLQPGAFDLVAVLYLHTASAERQRWLHRAAACVADGGTFVWIGHDPGNVSGGVGGPQDPDLLPDAAEIVAALEGFQILRAGVETRAVSADPGHGGTEGLALDCVVVAVKSA